MPPRKKADAGEDLFSFLAAPRPPAGYTELDRYRDFRRVFTGSEEGKRVLQEIMRLCCMARPMNFGNPIDPNLALVIETRRNLGFSLRHIIETEPQPKPTQTTRKP